MTDKNSFLILWMYLKVPNYLLLILNDINISGSFQTCLLKFVLFCSACNKQELKYSVFRKVNWPITYKFIFKSQPSHNFVQNSQISQSVFLVVTMGTLIHTWDFKNIFIRLCSKNNSGTACLTFTTEQNLQLHEAPKLLYACRVPKNSAQNSRLPKETTKSSSRYAVCLNSVKKEFSSSSHVSLPSSWFQV